MVDDLPMLQIYGQSMGTVSGLTALRDALTAAIESSEMQRAKFFPSDGEGYGLVIKPMTPDQLDR